MPNCQVCGVSMSVSEKTQGRQRNALPAATGNWHTVCELIEHHEALSVDALKACATVEKTKTTNRQISFAATPASAPTGAIANGAGVDAGVHKYVFTNVSADGESLPSPVSATFTNASTNLQNNVTGVVAGPAGTTSRNVYRTQAGGSVFNKVGTVAGNVTTTFTDNSSDASIVAAAQPPTYPHFKVGE